MEYSEKKVRTCSEQFNKNDEFRNKSSDFLVLFGTQTLRQETKNSGGELDVKMKYKTCLLKKVQGFPVTRNIFI